MLRRTVAHKVVLGGVVAAAILGSRFAAAQASAPGSEGRAVFARIASIPKLGAGVPLWFVDRPSLRGGTLRARDEAPVVIRLAALPDEGVMDRLMDTGARLAHRAFSVRRPTTLAGTHPRKGALIAAYASPRALERLATLDEVLAIELDGSPFGLLPPLDGTAAEVQAPDVWRQAAPDGLPLTGTTMTVCDIDSGVDVLHPLFFRADGGYFAWQDGDDDGSFDAGLDTVDVDGSVAPLVVLNGLAFGPSGAEPILGSESPALDVTLDWLYADQNRNGMRDAGRAAGFDDATPAFGEPLFVVDDVDGDGQLDPDEKLVRLSSSKIKATLFEQGLYVRGENLIDMPQTDAAHGSGAAGVIASGNRGLGRIVGVAPDVDLVMLARSSGGDAALFNLTTTCIEQGSRVVLHEYAPWQGYALDGSSALEALIDETSAMGVAHINPAGNLSGSSKLYKRQHPAGQTTDIDVEVPGSGFAFFGLSILWRDARALTLSLEDPTNHVDTLPDTDGQDSKPWHDGLNLFGVRDTSDRGTRRVDAYLFSMGSQVAIPPGTWKIHVTDPASSSEPAIQVLGYVQDEVSGWGLGIHFPQYDSEDHLIGFPGTADHSIAVAAYTGHGHWGGTPGERAAYSGRGVRIDGLELLSIAAPDDPLSPTFIEGLQASYFTFGGTSGASPHVAGAAALLLQAHPEWNGDDVRAAIRDGALADAAVGTVPNPDFGYGKLRIHKSLYGTDPPGGGPPQITFAPQTVATARDQEVVVDIDDPDEPAAGIELDIDRDYDGAWDDTATGGRFIVRYDEPGDYLLKLRARDATGREAATLAHITAVVRADEPPWVPSGGLGCTVSGGLRRWPWPGLGILFTALAIRPRARGTTRWCGRAHRRG